MHCAACGLSTAAKDRGYEPDDVIDVFRSVGISCKACVDKRNT